MASESSLRSPTAKTHLCYIVPIFFGGGPGAYHVYVHKSYVCNTYLYIYIYIFNPPCIAHYKVDILCAYKVDFRSPLYTPTMGDKAVFCARNMPLDLENHFIATLVFQFIPGWFPTRKRLNICGNALYRPLVPFKEWPKYVTPSTL